MLSVARLTRWLRKLVMTPRRPLRRHPSRLALLFDELEDRRVPSINPILDQTIGESSQLTVPISATGVDPITYGLDSAPAGSTINSSTGVFTWTPPPTD